MKKALMIFIFLYSYGLVFESHVFADENDTSAKNESTILKDPFSSMTSTEQLKSGIFKLTPEEQDALAKWWYQHKASPYRRHVTKEVVVTSIEDGGKRVTFSDGSILSFSSSKRKKTSAWAVGDAVGVGQNGRKGSVVLYHVASGVKVKGKREQFSAHLNKSANAAAQVK